MKKMNKMKAVGPRECRDDGAATGHASQQPLTRGARLQLAVRKANPRGQENRVIKYRRREGAGVGSDSGSKTEAQVAVTESGRADRAGVCAWQPSSRNKNIRKCLAKDGSAQPPTKQPPRPQRVRAMLARGASILIAVITVGVLHLFFLVHDDYDNLLVLDCKRLQFSAQ